MEQMVRSIYTDSAGTDTAPGPACIDFVRRDPSNEKRLGVLAWPREKMFKALALEGHRTV